MLRAQTILEVQPSGKPVPTGKSVLICSGLPGVFACFRRIGALGLGSAASVLQ
jgi:hypothetical protein